MLKKIGVLVVAGLVSASALAQETTVYTEANRAYKEGETFMKQGVFGKAQSDFLDAIELLRPVNEDQSRLLLARSEFNYAKCAILQGLPDGEKLMMDFINRYSPDPIANEAILEVANYYFDAGNYEKAVDFFEKSPTNGLSKKQKAEMQFKMGYAYFVPKEFKKAKGYFKPIANVTESDYYYPANYYLGLCYFFDGDYSRSVKHLRTAEKATRYKPHIPYYLTQIFFAERRYEELISYAEPRLKVRGLRNAKEISQLVGQSYFELGNYAQALPLLEHYANNTGKMRKEEFYQLGYTQYQQGDYRKAASNFEELTAIDSKMGQSAMFYLADCNIKLGDKKAARTALSKAKNMNYDKAMQEEARFNYAKLSYELKDPKEAVTNLQKIQPESPFYVEAQELMGDVFLSYRDYNQALSVMDKLPSKTPKIQESYQKVSLNRGIQLYQKGDMQSAKGMFKQSLKYPLDTRTKVLATYWLGDIAHKEEKYDESMNQMNQFLTFGRSQTGLPDESSVFMGNYIQGYNYLKKENYNSALTHFKEAVTGIKRNQSFIANSRVRKNVLGDATLRMGDCYFKRNKYNEAVKNYDEAIANKYSGYIYALYQKAIIEGLRGRVTDKIVALQQLANNYPKSEYADDALFQLGVTYQEIGQLGKASQPLEQLLSKYKNSSDLVTKSLLQLGLINYNRGNRQPAIEYYKQVFSNNPSPEEAQLALNALEEIYVKDMGRSDLYFAFLETVPGYKLDNLEKENIEFQAAEYQFEQTNYERAIQGFTSYIRKFPNGVQLIKAHYYRAESYTVLKNYSEALIDYEFVVQMGPSQYYEKALEKAAIIAYNHSMDYQKAYQFYSTLEEVASSEDKRFDAQLGALRAAYRNNNTTAVYDLASKVSIHPSATPEQRSTANFYLGKISFDRNDYTGAKVAFNKVIAESDNEQTAEARYLVAKIYYLSRDLTTAQEHCIDANKESSAYPYWAIKSVVLLSDILAETGKLYQAQAILERVLESYNEDQTLVNEVKQKLAKVNAQLNNSSNLDNDDTGRMEFIDDGNK